MINLIKTFPEQIKDAVELSNQINAADFSARDIQHIAISGMGGSGIGVHLVKSIMQDYCTVPITLIQGYDLPEWLNQHTLFIACSYSGNTEETLTILNLARKKTNQIFSVTTGGRLKKISEENNIPQFNFSGEAKCPRAGLAYPSVSVLLLLEKLGLSPKLNVEAELKSTVLLIKENQAAMRETAENLAKRIRGNFTFLYSDQRFYPAVLRFQQQLAENSKQLSHAHVFPELNHNELVGWVFPEQHVKKSKAILLRSEFDHERNQKRMDISKAIIAEKAEVLELMAGGNTFTQQLYYFIHLIDWVSFYLAEENQIDPFPVESIDFLKNKLAE